MFRHENKNYTFFKNILRVYVFFIIFHAQIIYKYYNNYCNNINILKSFFCLEKCLNSLAISCLDFLNFINLDYRILSSTGAYH